MKLFSSAKFLLLAIIPLIAQCGPKPPQPEKMPPHSTWEGIPETHPSTVKVETPKRKTFSSKHCKSPTGVHIIIDKSGSTQSGRALEAFKATALKLMDTISDATPLSVVAYDDRPFRLAGFRVHRGDERKAVSNRIQRLSATGRSSLLPTLEVTNKAIEGFGANCQVVVIFSDGRIIDIPSRSRDSAAFTIGNNGASILLALKTTDKELGMGDGAVEAFVQNSNGTIIAEGDAQRFQEKVIQQFRKSYIRGQTAPPSL